MEPKTQTTTDYSIAAQIKNNQDLRDGFKSKPTSTSSLLPDGYYVHEASFHCLNKYEKRWYAVVFSEAGSGVFGKGYSSSYDDAVRNALENLKEIFHD